MNAELFVFPSHCIPVLVFTYLLWAGHVRLRGSKQVECMPLLKNDVNAFCVFGRFSCWGRVCFQRHVWVSYVPNVKKETVWMTFYSVQWSTECFERCTLSCCCEALRVFCFSVSASGWLYGNIHTEAFLAFGRTFVFFISVSNKKFVYCGTF